MTGHLQDDSTSYVNIFSRQTASTDAEGRFTFDKVMAMPGLRIARQDPRDQPGSIWSVGEAVRVEDGQTLAVTIGGKGRPIVGRVEPPDAWGRPVDFTDRCTVAIESNRTHDPFPMEMLRGKTNLEEVHWSEWSQAWRKTPEGRDYADARVAISTALAPDGSFRIDDVPPGEYRVQVRVNGQSTDRKPSPFATVGAMLTIPPIPGGRIAEPLDLGRLQLSPRRVLKVGDPVPPIGVTTVDGKELAIPGDFIGRTLLLDLGGELVDTGPIPGRSSERCPCSVRQGPALRDGEPAVRP